MEWFKGTFTVERRAVTVEIRDQGATYDPETAQVHGYAFDASAWAIVERAGDGLAESETSEVLGIVLTVAGKAAAETLGNAGAYAISGDWENKTNYNVTFEGSYAGEEYAGKAGTYTIEKLDVSDAVIYMLLVGEEGNEGTTEETKEGHTVRVKYAGKDLPLKCDATLYMGQLEINLTAKLDHDSITGEGNLTVVVTIEDTNYCGGTKFLVIVTDANGYTEHLKAVLKTLAELVKGLDKAALKAEDYETLVEVYGALESLDAAEREVGAVQLAEYQEYVDAWEELADIDDVLETAEAIADAPIKSLFAAAAMLTALAGLAYIATKGGLL